MKEILRDTIEGKVTLDYLAKRVSEGWAVSSIEWVREGEGVSTVPAPVGLLEDASMLPFGLRVSERGFVEENPMEATVLLLILEQIVKEKRVQEIARELNDQHFVTREGRPWTATDVFNLLPRLVEAGPTLLKSAAWQQRRDAVLANPRTRQ
jgi:hypothetical protein